MFKDVGIQFTHVKVIACVRSDVPAVIHNEKLVYFCFGRAGQNVWLVLASWSIFTRQILNNAALNKPQHSNLLQNIVFDLSHF